MLTIQSAVAGLVFNVGVNVSSDPSEALGLGIRWGGLEACRV